MRVVYFLRRFPVLSHSFVSTEIAGIIASGQEVAVCSFLKPTDEIVSDHVIGILPHVHYAPGLKSWRLWQTNLLCLLRSPQLYLTTFAVVLSSYRRTPREFWQALYFSFLAIYFASEISLGKKQDVIITHWVDTIVASCATVRRMTGTPFIVRAHTHRELSVSPGSVYLLRFASHLLADFQSLADAFEKKLEPMNVAVHRIPQAIDLRPYVALSLPTDAPLITLVSVGRLVEKKGFRYLIDACARLAQEGLSFRCLIVGDGELRSDLESQIEANGLQKQVTLVGAVPLERLAEYYGVADVFVLANIASDQYTDGLPTVIVEAMAVGRPVVASRAAGVPEAVDDRVNGLLVPPGDADALATALAELIQNSSHRMEMGRNARSTAVSRFSLDQTIADLLDVLSVAPFSTNDPSVCERY